MKIAKQSPGYSLPKAPKYRELPTAKRRAARSGPELVELRVQLEVVTPILGGSHQTRAVDEVDVIRAPSVRGHLRFWWRALYASKYSSVAELGQFSNWPEGDKVRRLSTARQKRRWPHSRSLLCRWQVLRVRPIPMTATKPPAYANLPPRRGVE